ncbi:hypothetical protein HPB49_002668 [Dermacentor silvarum]|uniref:Uncharacterized protein n=1 Tax=Dermacentor silvarum TaxID=543639 RepID=A0ACB8DTB1_DERSI|nr:hypothetical protein HPB49_002668 [Dermacentor silvarum]
MTSAYRSSSVCDVLQLERRYRGCLVVDAEGRNYARTEVWFLCLKNIRTFLQTCKNVFNLSNSDLFEPNMLFEYGDFRKVLHTLAVLSRSPKAEESGVRSLRDSRRHLRNPHVSLLGTPLEYRTGYWLL